MDKDIKSSCFAERIMHCVRCKLSKMDQRKTGVVKPIKEEPVPVGNIHYLSHREVIREDKGTTKLRVVYDASEKSPGTSLNDCLAPDSP